MQDRLRFHHVTVPLITIVSQEATSESRRHDGIARRDRFVACIKCRHTAFWPGQGLSRSPRNFGTGLSPNADCRLA